MMCTSTLPVFNPVKTYKKLTSEQQRQQARIVKYALANGNKATILDKQEYQNDIKQVQLARGKQSMH